MTVPERSDVLASLAREHSGQVLALLARRFSDLDLADDAVQEALIEATRRWSTNSPAAEADAQDEALPSNFGGWLYRVASRKALDQLRRRSAEQRRIERNAPDLTPTTGEPAEDRPMLIDLTDADDHYEQADERLRLVLLCCHPALNESSQVALTLRLVAGLTTEEIAAAFLLPTPTLAARITRAKKKIRAANIPLSVPEQLDTRISAVLSVLYLIFNEGYLSRAATAPMRIDLCDEAIRLTTVVSTLAEDHAETHGLLALLRFTHARRDARFRADTLVLLEEQDRRLWRLDEIQAANQALHRAIQLRAPGVYQVQALIASHHCAARVATDTDWVRILSLYDQLLAMQRSPVVALNRAVAVAMADGPLAGLRELDGIESLDDYHLFHSTRGELLVRAGDIANARPAFERAHELASNPSELAHLRSRIDSIS